jgi:hypothetical protein
VGKTAVVTTNEVADRTDVYGDDFVLCSVRVLDSKRFEVMGVKPGQVTLQFQNEKGNLADEVSTEDYFCRQYTGVSLSQAGGEWWIAEGQSLTGQVVNAATLARHGLEGLSQGDEVTVTWLGGTKFKFLHAASGKSVEIVFPKDKVKIRQVKK